MNCIVIRRGKFCQHSPIKSMEKLAGSASLRWFASRLASWCNWLWERWALGRLGCRSGGESVQSCTWPVWQKHKGASRGLWMADTYPSNLSPSLLSSPLTFWESWQGKLVIWSQGAVTAKTLKTSCNHCLFSAIIMIVEWRIISWRLPIISHVCTPYT